MKIIVCGDSFFAQDPLYPDTHLVDHVSRHFNSDLKVYSKLGASNFSICLQLEHAIDQRPDLILFGFTSVDRIEVPAGPYVFLNGIKNIIYSGHQYQPPYYNPRLVTTVSNSIVNLERTDHLKSYLVNYYNEELKRAQDFMMVRAMLYKLEKEKIPFVFTRGGLTGPNWTEWSANEIDFESASPWNFVSDHSPTYHTAPEKQAELGRLWIEFITKIIV